MRLNVTWLEFDQILSTTYFDAFVLVYMLILLLVVSLVRFEPASWLLKDDKYFINIEYGWSFDFT